MSHESAYEHHAKAAKHFEHAAEHHHEAATHFEAGNMKPRRIIQ